MARKVTLNELRAMIYDAYGRIWDTARANGRKPLIVMHWSAGRYNDVHSCYHINIVGNGDIYVTTNDLAEIKSHCWKRNSGSIAVSICGCFDAGSRNLGSEPPTKEQIESMARVCAVLYSALGFPMPVQKKYLCTHGEAADCDLDEKYPPHNPYSWWNDSYGDGDTRGDLEYLGTSESPKYNPYATDGSRGGDVLRGKAAWYINKWANEGNA